MELKELWLHGYHSVNISMEFRDYGEGVGRMIMGSYAMI